MHQAYQVILFIAPLLLLITPLLHAETERNITHSTQTYVIGKTNNGCILGAKSLPLEGDGYLVIHLERQRYYGHPLLIDTLQTLAKQTQEQQLGMLQIGDLGRKKGGALPFGHRSHQSGLDVDVWFNLNAKSYAQANKQRSNINQPSMLNSKKNGLNKRWTNKHRQLLKLAAEIEAVDRIFVNPYIKRDLCHTTIGKRQWLQKIRPWYYHDDHFHIRLRCPDSSPDCIKQALLPAGDSCDASLAWWFKKHPASHAKKRTKPKLPKACRVLLSK